MKWIKYKLPVGENNKELSLGVDVSTYFGLYKDTDNRYVMACLVEDNYEGEEITNLNNFVELLDQSGVIVDDILITHVAPNSFGEMVEYTYSPYQKVVELWNKSRE